MELLVLFNEEPDRGRFLCRERTVALQPEGRLAGQHFDGF